jgi:acetyl-CoA acetyltransferase
VSRHPFGEVAIAGVFNTRQARFLEGYTSHTLRIEAALGVLDLLGLGRQDVDGVVGGGSAELIYDLGLGPVWSAMGIGGIRGLTTAAQAIATEQAETVIVVDGAAGVYTARDSTAPWTRPTNEFVVGAGLFTAAEFALVARRHMEVFGTTPEQLARVSSTIRNNGHINPEAVYYGRGPFTPEDVLASRMVADPFHLLDCSMTSEGGIGVVVTTAERARDLPFTPVYILGVGLDQMGPAYQHAPMWDLHAFDSDEMPLGYVGRRAARHAFATAGLKPSDIQTFEFYDAFSFEIIRQLEAFEFVGPGEGGAFVEEGNLDPGGSLPINTDGGLMSFNHSGIAQALQRVGRAAQQIQGICPTLQLDGVDVAMVSNFGAGALFCDVAILGSEQP